MYRIKVDDLVDSIFSGELFEESNVFGLGIILADTYNNIINFKNLSLMINIAI